MTAALPTVEALLEADIQSRVAELGDAIAADYEGRVPIFVVVMMGSVPFAADLIRRVGIESEIDFLVLNRFGEGGRIGIAMDLWTPVIDRDVVIVEDITDTGLTLSVLRKTILDRGAKSVATASLIDKTAAPGDRGPHRVPRFRGGRRVPGRLRNGLAGLLPQPALDLGGARHGGLRQRPQGPVRGDIDARGRVG